MNAPWLNSHLSGLATPLPSKDDPERVHKLLAEYSARFLYQNHLMERQWKVVSAYFLIYGFVLAAISTNASIMRVNAPLIIAVFILTTVTIMIVYNQRNRRVLNCERLNIVSSELGLKGITHYSEVSRSILRAKAESSW